MAATRGSNPIWLLADLVGHLFDDNFYLYVLENDIPYIPANVWHDEAETIVWTQPIQFLANGTLPIDIFFDDTVLYRLEFRQNLGVSPPSQSDPLIYLVEDYSPTGGGGSTPITAGGVISDNQITNPQFSQLSFNPVFTLTGISTQLIEIAPGWFLDLTGSGNVTLDRLAMNNALANPTNAPYALHLIASGSWTGVKLRQFFSQNGMLWSGKYVASSVTAMSPNVPTNISAILVDSQGATIATVLGLTQISTTFQEYQDKGLVAATTNTNTPPAAFIEYQLLLPNAFEIYLTSFQLVASSIATNFNYVQDTIERQNDYTWHYYQDSVIIQPKASVLTGWNFALNPFQFINPTLAPAAAQTQYICDQTILHQIASGGTLNTGRATGYNNYLAIQAIPGFSSNRLALIQYVDPSTIRPYWGQIMSALARLCIVTSHGSQVGIKMRLIASTILPATISATEPILTWSGVDPVFSSNWGAVIVPENDPTYILPNLSAGAPIPAVPFNNFQLPIMLSQAETIGIVIYTTANINNTSGSADFIIVDGISLVPNRFAIDSIPETFNKVLADCQYYYETSYPLGVLPFTANAPGFLVSPQNVIIAGSTTAMFTTEIDIQFNTIKRAAPSSTQMRLFAFTDGVIDNVTGIIYGGGSQVATGDIPITNYAGLSTTQRNATYFSNNATPLLSGTHATTNVFSLAIYHYACNVLLGI